MKSVELIKGKLKNRALKTHRLFNELLQIYFLERFLYRLSISKYNEVFTIKGGVLLYALFDKNYTRATTDIDLLGNKISNDIVFIKNIIKEICLIEADDPIIFEVDKLKIKKITEFKEYHGINISIPTYMDKIHVNVKIDIGFGDVIYPQKTIMEFPTLIDDCSPLIYAYSKESVISEKLESIISLGLLNSRMKDFYDLYVFSKTYDFNGKILKEAIIETFNHRNTGLDEILAFEDEFITTYRKRQWNSFLKKKCPTTKADLKDVIEQIKIFLLPIIFSIRNHEEFNKNWEYMSNDWK